MLKLPLTTLSMVGIAIIVTLSPSLATLLTFERAAFEGGSWWMLLTSNFTHWSTEHLFWDAATFCFLGCIIEKDGWSKFSIALITFLSAITITFAVYIFSPELQTYRGLSGLCVTFFVIVALNLLKSSRKSGDLLMVYISSAALVGLVLKTIFETTTGQTLFVQNSNDLFSVVPIAHLVGAVCGCLAVVLKPSYSLRNTNTLPTFNIEKNSVCSRRP